LFLILRWAIEANMICRKAFLAEGIADFCLGKYLVVARRSFKCFPGAYVDKESEKRIGEGTEIQSNAVIGKNVVIGNSCSVGAGAVIENARIGNNVVIHPGVCIGQDGFGFTIGSMEHEKKPQELNVIISSNVEIGYSHASVFESDRRILTCLTKTGLILRLTVVVIEIRKLGKERKLTIWCRLVTTSRLETIA